MKWREFLTQFGTEAILETGMLLARDEPPSEVQRQLSRWVSAGRLVQLRRGLYTVSQPYARAASHPFLIANRLQFPSYVSLHSALSYHGVIPEAVPVVTSVTTRRPRTDETPLGTFVFRHLHRSLFWGYEETRVGDGTTFFVASPEKALLDLVHLTPGRVTEDYVESLRLEPDLSLDKLAMLADRTGKPKLRHAARVFRRVLETGEDSH